MNKNEFQQQKLKAWLIWLIAVSYFFFDYVQQVAPSAMDPALIKTFSLNAIEVGAIASSYYFSYAIMQIPIGFMVDYFGPKRPLSIAAILASLLLFLFSQSINTEMAIITRFLLGGVTAFSFVSCLKLATNWFPQIMLGRMSGLTNTIAMIGAMTAETPLSILISNFGWRHSMMLLALFFLIVACLIIFFVHDKPKPKQAIQQTTKRKHTLALKTELQHVKLLLTDRESWFNGVYAACINVPFAAFAALWGVPFLEQTYQLTTSKATAMVSLVFFGAIFGSVFWGWLSDWLQLRRAPMITAACLSILFMGLILYLPKMPMPVLNICLFGLGLAASGNILAYALGIDLAPGRSAGFSLGFVNTWLIGGAALSQFIVSSLIQVIHKYSATPVASQYTAKEFALALSFVTLCLIIAATILIFVRETYCQHQQDKVLAQH